MAFGDLLRQPPAKKANSSSARTPGFSAWSSTLGGAGQMLVLFSVLAMAGKLPAALEWLLPAALLLSVCAAPCWSALTRTARQDGGIVVAAAERLRPLAPLLGTMLVVCYWWGHCAVAALALGAVLRALVQLWPQLAADFAQTLIALLLLLVVVLPGAHSVRRTLASGAALVLLTATVWLLAHGAALSDTVLPGAASDALTEAGGFMRIGNWCALLFLVGPLISAPEAILAVPRGALRRAGIGARMVWLTLAASALMLMLLLAGRHGLVIEADAQVRAGRALLLLAAGLLAFRISTMAALAAVGAAAFSLGGAAASGQYSRRQRTLRRIPMYYATAAAIGAFCWLSGEVWIVVAAGLAYFVALTAVAGMGMLAAHRSGSGWRHTAGRSRLSRTAMAAAGVWLLAAVLGLQAWGVQAVLLGLAMVYCGGIVHLVYTLPGGALRARAAQASVHAKLLAGMLLVLALNGAAYLVAQQALLGLDPAMAALLGDAFTVVALLTVAVGLILPTLIVHSLTNAALAAEQLSHGAVAGLRNDIDALGRGELDTPNLSFPMTRLRTPFKDEIGRIAASINTLQDEVRQAALGLTMAREKLRRSRDELSHQARHDSLTGLHNRRAFEDELARLVADRRDHGPGHALLYLDLDQFKIVNDTCGHDAGDELLRQVSLLLHAQMRADDVLSRLGGDEFGVILADCSMDNASRIGEAMVVAVRELSFGWREHVFRIGVSIGLVHFVSGTTTLTEVMSCADQACYYAKEQGRNRLHAYSPDDDEISTRSGEMQWVSRIHEALEQGRMCLHAQRIRPLQAAVGELDHHELLLRMVDVNGELVPPMAFIPAAERFGVMTLLDRWVVRSALERLGDLVRGPTQANFGTIAINLSGTSITDEAFLEFVKEQFRLSRVPYHLVWFEITETSAIANLRRAKRFIAELRGLGCRFGLDDFGAGMSSFGYLRTLEVDFLKIDGAFVQDMADDPIDHAMVASINRIGQLMGLRTIAEFVDGERTIALLRELGVDMVQGNGVASPIPFVQANRGTDTETDALASSLLDA